MTRSVPPGDSRLHNPRFPRSSKYHPDWITSSVSGGANSLWLAEWLTSALDLKPGMRILDLGCGRGASSIFLHREFGVEVWATDLWFDVSERSQRIKDAGAESSVFPIYADARSLPFANDFFDAILSIDSYFYYGTDDHYLNYLLRFVKPDGPIAIAGASLGAEIDGPIPEHLRDWWTPDCWCLHSAPWWRRHWEKTGLVDVKLADSLADGWQYWVEWIKTIAPDNAVEIAALEADRGQCLTYARVVARRRLDSKLADPVASVPTEYTKHPLLRIGN